jgi:hypothetical protein
MVLRIRYALTVCPQDSTLICIGIDLTISKRSVCIIEIRFLD